MASENTIIIDVEVQASDAAQKLAQTKQQIAALKSEQKQLNEFIKAGADTTGELSAQYAQNAAEIKQLTAQEKMYTAQLNITTQGNRAMGDSLVEMSATLAQLKAEYRGMTAAQRESAGGKELLASIQQLDAKMKEADGTMGDFQRNVGNYTSAFGGLGGNVQKVASLFAGGFKNGLAAAGNAVKALGKTLLTTPIGWILAGFKAVMVVVDQVKEAFKRNDDAGTALSAAMARLQPVITGIRKAFDGLATVIATVVGGITKAASAVIGFLVPSFKAASQAAEGLKRAEDALQDTERQYTIDSAERAKQRAQLENEARSNEKLTAEQRLDLLQQSMDLAKEDLADRKKIAAEKYRLLQEEAKETNDTSDAMKDRLAEAYAAMINAETEFAQGTRRLNQQMKSAREEIERDQKQAAEEARRRWEQVKKARQEAAKTELDELRKLEDLTIAMIADIATRTVEQTRVRYEREIADLKVRLDTEKNLTAAAREAINRQIVLLEKQKNAEIEAINQQADEEAIKNRIAAQEAGLRAQAEAIAEQQDLVRLSYENLAKQYANDLERALLEAGENVRTQAEANLRYAEQSLETLQNMDTETRAVMFDTVADYEAAVLAAEKAIADARKNGEEAFLQQVETIGNTMQEVTGALSSLFEAAAEDSEAYEKFRKAIAIVDAMISMAQTIAAATTASTAGDPYTMAIRIAANVAAVTAQFAAVIKAIKAASVPSSPSFSEGGVVPGESYTGDRVTARLNSGEMILTRGMQENLLRLLSGVTPAFGSDWSGMREAFRDAVAELPAPTLVYSEFQDFTRNVRKINNITKL